MFKQLRNKFITMNMVIISLLFSLVFGLLYTSQASSIKTDNQNTMNQLLDSISTTNNMNLGVSTFISSVGYNPSFTIILDRYLNPLGVQSQIQANPSLYQKALEEYLKSNKTEGRITLDGKTWLFKADLNTRIDITNIQSDDTGVYIPSGHAVAFLDISNSQAVLRNLSMSLLAIGVSILFVIYLISRYFAKKAIQPIEAAYQAQEVFLSDASHELKTPLAALIANTEVILSNPENTVSSQEQWFSHIQDESMRMSKLVNGLLYLSKIDLEDQKLILENLDMSQHLQDIILIFEALIFEKGLNLELNIADNIMVQSNLESLDQIIRILIGNAIKYSDDKGSIKMNLQSIKNQVVFTISYTGDGIPYQDLDHIFDRFYRVNTARTGDGSFGIGLSIAQVLANKLNAKLTVDSIPDHLTTFTLTI